MAGRPDEWAVCLLPLLRRRLLFFLAWVYHPGPDISTDVKRVGLGLYSEDHRWAFRGARLRLGDRPFERCVGQVAAARGARVERWRWWRR